MRLYMVDSAVIRASRIVDVKKPQSIPGETKSFCKILVLNALFSPQSCGSIGTRGWNSADLWCLPDRQFFSHLVMGEKATCLVYLRPLGFCFPSLPLFL